MTSPLRLNGESVTRPSALPFRGVSKHPELYTLIRGDMHTQTREAARAMGATAATPADSHVLASLCPPPQYNPKGPYPR